MNVRELLFSKAFRAARVATALAAAGCTRSTPEPVRPTPAVVDAGASTATAAPARVPGTGRVEGVVRLVGVVPPPSPIVIDHDVEQMRGCAAAARGYYATPFGITAPGPLPEALVTVDAHSATQPTPQRRHATYDDCSITPRFVAMFLTDTLVLHASTDAHHLTMVDGAGATIAQMLLPGEDQEKHVTRPGRYILHSRLFPNWMQSPLVAVLNPYFDQTDAAGRYVVENVPPGTYAMHAWFPGAGAVDASVTVVAGQTAQQDFALSALPPSAVRPPAAPDAGPPIP